MLGTNPKKRKPTPPLTPEQATQREKVFMIYRDLGPTRGLTRLAKVLKDAHPELAVSRPSLESWSVRHDWVTRVKLHDDTGGNAAVALQAKAVDDDPINALMTLAKKTLARAAAANAPVTRPNEIKSLIDSAANALKLIEQIKASQQTQATAEEIGAELDRVVTLVENRRREDVTEIALAVIEKVLSEHKIEVPDEALIEEVARA